MTDDVVIIGAGPAGLSFARMLAALEVRCTLIEKQPIDALQAPEFDGRDIALTHLSRRILQKSNIWDLMPESDVGRIQEARVLNGISDYFLHFDQRETTRDELGYMASNHVIRKAVFDAVKDDDRVRLMSGVEVTDISSETDQLTVGLSDGSSISAPLVVAADSRFSSSRRKMGIPADMHDFGKVVIVCRMEVEEDHKGVAFECFHYGRTLAVLPLPGNVVSVVITAKTEDADHLVKMDAEAFGADISRRFGYRLGNMSLASPRFPYTLVAVLARRFVANRFALVGDAAVGMHPVTAHGFNLGLQSADTLAHGIERARKLGKDIGSEFVLRRYHRQHRRAALPIYHGTNEVVRLFNSESFKARIARDAVLRISNNLSPLKSVILNRLTEINPGILPPPPGLRSLLSR